MKVDLQEIVDGFGRPQKELPPKYFYDERGSELFEAITRTDEYYPTRSERALLESRATRWVEALAPRALVELGAGAATKTRILLDALRAVAPGAAYVPVDISRDFLEATAAGLEAEYPDLVIRPLVADMSARLAIPADLPRPALFALLGGTIGNFDGPDAVALLARIRAGLEPDDRLLLGADLVKEAAVLERAYNDADGVTAAFNLNVLEVLNRQADSDFDPAGFRHRAFYDAHHHRIEMHLVARRPMTVTIPGAGTFGFAEGESIRTEISCKYDRVMIDGMLRQADLQIEAWAEGPTARERFGLALARPVGPTAPRRAVR